VEPNAASFARLNLRFFAGPAAFDVMNAERVELLGDAEFVRDREVDAFALTAVAQGRVVYFDFGFHNIVRKKPEKISKRNGRRLQISKPAEFGGMMRERLSSLRNRKNCDGSWTEHANLVAAPIQKG
jgi:hypothetical protein